MEISKYRNEVEPAQLSMSQYMGGNLLFSATRFNFPTVVTTLVQQWADGY